MSVNWEEIIWAGIEKLELTHSCQSEKLKQSAQDYYQQGKAFKNSGDIASAIVNFTQAIELAPDNVNAYFGRGASYSYLGKYQNSIDDFSRLVEFHPTAANYYNRGVIYYLMKKYKKAIANFTQAISLKPNFVASYLSIANAYYELDNCKLAHNNYKKAKHINYQLSSHDEHGFFAQGIAALNQEDVTKGIKYLQQAALICCQVNNFALNIKINSIIIENNQL